MPLCRGQRQRLAIARALANEPTPVLADEPTGALDSEGGEEVLELFRRLHAGGQTILLVTHDQPVADAAERIVKMKDGRAVDHGGRDLIADDNGGRGASRRHCLSVDRRHEDRGPCPASHSGCAGSGPIAGWVSSASASSLPWPEV